jgi:hypothetical protein
MMAIEIDPEIEPLFILITFLLLSEWYYFFKWLLILTVFQVKQDNVFLYQINRKIMVNIIQGGSFE